MGYPQSALVKQPQHRHISTEAQGSKVVLRKGFIDRHPKVSEEVALDLVEGFQYCVRGMVNRRRAAFDHWQNVGFEL